MRKSISIRLFRCRAGARRNNESFDRIWLPWIESRYVFSEELRQRQIIRLDALDDAPGQLIAAIVIVVGAVLERFPEVITQSSVKDFAHGIQTYERAILFFGH